MRLASIVLQNGSDGIKTVDSIQIDLSWILLLYVATHLSCGREEGGNLNDIDTLHDVFYPDDKQSLLERESDGC